MLYQGSDGQVHVLGDGEELKHWKYIKKIKSGNGWRYFYSQDEINAYMKEVQGAAKGVKKKIDSIPRLQEHDNGKYYIANKKQQKNIQKNIEYSRKLNRRSARYNDAAKRDMMDMNARKRIVNANKINGIPSTRTVRDEKGSVLYTRKDPTAKDVANKAMSYSINKAKSEAARSAADSVYNRNSKYEAKNVAKRKLSEVKNKTKKITKGKNKIEDKIKRKKLKYQAKRMKKEANNFNANRLDWDNATVKSKYAKKK